MVRNIFDHPVCSTLERGLSLLVAATPPLEEGNTKRIARAGPDFLCNAPLGTGGVDAPSNVRKGADGVVILDGPPRLRFHKVASLYFS